MQSTERVQTGEGTLADASNPTPAAAPSQHDSREPTAAPLLLANEQILKLQKILRSMDHAQLQTVLAALEPNVLRLCLHAIFGKSNDSLAQATPFEQKQPTSGSSLAAHAKILAQTKAHQVPIAKSSQKSGAAISAAMVSPSELRRLNPRIPTQKNAKIYCPIDKVNIDCLILDTSKSGALVFLDYSGELPETFDLFDIGDQQSGDVFTHLPHKKCKCVWHKRNKMGVKFVD